MLKFIGNNDFVWSILQKIIKISFERGDVIYTDDKYANSMYLIHQGYVKLYAENDFPFAVFRVGHHFGDVDIFCSQKRNGTAKAMDSCSFYKIRRHDIQNVIVDYPISKAKLIESAIQLNT